MCVECGTSQCIFTEICEKLHDIARYLTRLTRRTRPAGRATPHIRLDGYEPKGCFHRRNLTANLIANSRICSQLSQINPSIVP